MAARLAGWAAGAVATGGGLEPQWPLSQVRPAKPIAPAPSHSSSSSDSLRHPDRSGGLGRSAVSISCARTGAVGRRSRG